MYSITMRLGTIVSWLHILVSTPTTTRAAFFSHLQSSLCSSPAKQRTMSFSLPSDNNENNNNNNKKRAAIPLFHETPLIQSAPLTKLCNRPIYLKLDALQPSGSFKDRGMAHLCETLLLREEKGNGTKLISSSGGNAGLAVTTVASVLGMDVHVIVPETTKPMVLQKLKSLGAQVTVYGLNWNAADALAKQLVQEDPRAEYVSPYDNPLLWKGHSSLVTEIVRDLPIKLGGIIASVGGGGLLCGVFEGLDRHGLVKNVAVVAAETEGAASFGKSFLANNHDNGAPIIPIRLETIDSVATSLGALEVTPVSLERAKSHQECGGTVQSAICTDKEAVDACVKFAADHRILVEPACGAALAVVYSERLRCTVLDNIPIDTNDGNNAAIVVEVCGGSGVNLELLEAWREEFL